MGYLLLLLIGILVLHYAIGAFNWLRGLDADARRRRRIAEDEDRISRQTPAPTLKRSMRRPPLCLEALGLTSSASPDEVLAAYRQLAFNLHPDRGGDPEQFKRLHRNFEHAMSYAEARVEAKSAKPR